jgi:VanZ family protein
MIAIFGFSSVQGSAIPSAVSPYSPIAHFTEYAVLAALLVFGAGGRRLTVSLAITLLLVCSLYGVSDEFHQRYVTGRTPDPVDWATDTAGAATALAAIALVRRRRT